MGPWRVTVPLENATTPGSSVTLALSTDPWTYAQVCAGYNETLRMQRRGPVRLLGRCSIRDAGACCGAQRLLLGALLYGELGAQACG